MKSSLRIKIFLKSHKKEARFVFLFIIFFLLLQILHYSVRSYTSPLLVHKLNANVSSKVINIITPDEQAFARGHTIGSGNFAIAIAEGCEGIEGILLIVAALCAFPMGIKQKISGIMLGSMIIYLSNLVRIAVLYYTLKYKPGIFDVTHVYVGQTFIIFVGVLFFITWITIFAKHDAKTD